MFTMLLNHIANIFLQTGTWLCEVFIAVGYFTAISMIYFLVEGYDYTRSKKKYFLRLIVEDRTGILAGVAGVLGNNNVSINQVIQKPAVDGVAELVVITDKVENRHLHDALMIFGEMSMIREVASVIRVYTQK